MRPLSPLTLLPSKADEIAFANAVLNAKRDKALHPAAHKKPFSFTVVDRHADGIDELALFLNTLQKNPAYQRIQILSRIQTNAIGGKHWHTIDLEKNEKGDVRACIVDAAGVVASVIYSAQAISSVFPAATLYYISPFSQKDGQNCLLFSIENASSLRNISAETLYNALANTPATTEHLLGLLKEKDITLPQPSENSLFTILGITHYSEALASLLRKITCYSPIKTNTTLPLPPCCAVLCRDTQRPAEMAVHAKNLWSETCLLKSEETIESYLKNRNYLYQETHQLKNSSIIEKSKKWQRYLLFKTSSDKNASPTPLSHPSEKQTTLN